MNTMLEINKKKVPAVRIDPSLDKYDDVVLFADKLAVANERLAKSGFPNLPDSRHQAMPTKFGEIIQ